MVNGYSSRNMSKYLYLSINIFTLLPPLLFGFDRRVAFWHRNPRLPFSVSLVALIFILWDIYFTEIGVWSFNPEYLVGFNIVNLPLEEILFFFTIPLASVFIFQVVKHYLFKDRTEIHHSGLPRDKWKNWGLPLVLALALIIFFQVRGIYTLTVLSLSILITPFCGQAPWWPVYRVSFLVHLLPFLLVNGILTAMPVVKYNSTDILNLRVGTIPVEDFLYAHLLLLSNVFLSEWLKKPSAVTPTQSCS